MTAQPDHSTRFAKMKFRAWHRGTREADYMMGGFFDRYHAEWDDAAMRWFEDLLDHDDVDVLAWALQAQPAPPRFHGALLEAFQRIDYVSI
jgi:antitoxin CptB